MDVETNGEQLGEAGSLIVLYVTVLLTLLVLPPLMFPESHPKSKAQFLGYVAGAVLWPVIILGWGCRVVQRAVFWFWSLPVMEQEPNP